MFHTYKVRFENINLQYCYCNTNNKVNSGGYPQFIIPYFYHSGP